MTSPPKSSPPSQRKTTPPAPPEPTKPLTPPAPPEAAKVTKPLPPLAPPEGPKVTKPLPPLEPPKPPAPTVKYAVIIDDEPANRDFLLRLIEQASFKTVGAASGEEARQVAGALEVDPMLLIIDSRLPDVEGTELIKTFREKYPAALLVMATMLDDRDLIERAFKNGVDVFLVKPHGFMELFKRLQNLEQNPDALKRLIIDNLGARTFR